MNKKTKYAINGAIIVGLIKVIYDAWEQLTAIEKNPRLFFDWNRLFIAGSKGALIGGATGFTVGAFVDESYSKKKPINTDAYLYSVLDTIRVDKQSQLHITAERKCENVMRFLKSHFNFDLASSPFIWGSITKGTAIEGKSDFDIIVRFKRNSYSLEEMYNELFYSLNENYHDKSLQEVRKQSKSIGLIYLLGNNQIKIDVVPIRDINNDSRDSGGNLYRRPASIFSKGSYTKTDISIQASDVLTPSMKRVIMILKKWKTDKDIPMSSYMIQVFVQEAFSMNSYSIPVGLTQKVMMVLKYIKENIYTSKLTSIENSNNHLNNLSQFEKDQVFEAIKSLLDEYSYHPNTLKSFIS